MTAPLPGEDGVLVLDDTDRAILNGLQAGFPVCRRPYREAAARLGLGETELIERLDSLRARGAITRFGPFIDAAALGGAFCLCAMAIPETEFDWVAMQVNAYAEVAHNYRREHRLNMWFVLATETPEEIGSVADAIRSQTGHEVLMFPKLEEYFIGFRVAL